jgi:hypothetical protein
VILGRHKNKGLWLFASAELASNVFISAHSGQQSDIGPLRPPPFLFLLVLYIRPEFHEQHHQRERECQSQRDGSSFNACAATKEFLSTEFPRPGSPGGEDFWVCQPTFQQV